MVIAVEMKAKYLLKGRNQSSFLRSRHVIETVLPYMQILDVFADHLQVHLPLQRNATFHTSKVR